MSTNAEQKLHAYLKKQTQTWSRRFLSYILSRDLISLILKIPMGRALSGNGGWKIVLDKTYLLIYFQSFFSLSMKTYTLKYILKVTNLREKNHIKIFHLFNIRSWNLLWFFFFSFLPKVILVFITIFYVNSKIYFIIHSFLGLWLSTLFEKK